ncbi:ribonuclease P/MRP subunit, partial [Nothobranchius furzeri]
GQSSVHNCYQTYLSGSHTASDSTSKPDRFCEFVTSLNLCGHMLCPWARHFTQLACVGVGQRGRRRQMAASPLSERSSTSRMVSLHVSCLHSSPQLVQQKLLKADLHGAILTVVRSRCPSYVGTTGILVQEFKHVFRLITKEDKLKVIPKRNSVFSVEINGFVSHIYGSKFQQRASERSAKKFKIRGTMDL